MLCLKLILIRLFLFLITENFSVDIWLCGKDLVDLVLNTLDPGLNIIEIQFKTVISHLFHRPADQNLQIIQFIHITLLISRRNPCPKFHEVFILCGLLVDIRMEDLGQPAVDFLCAGESVLAYRSCLLCSLGIVQHLLKLCIIKRHFLLYLCLHTCGIYGKTSVHSPAAVAYGLFLLDALDLQLKVGSDQISEFLCIGCHI